MWTLESTTWTDVGTPKSRASSEAGPALGRVEETTEVGKALEGKGAGVDGPGWCPADAAGEGLGFDLLAGGWEGPAEGF